MKRAAVYSFFESYNIGDVLIAEQIEKIFSPHMECEFFDISSGKPSEVCGLRQLSPNENKSDRKSFKTRLLSVPILKTIITSLLFLRSKGYLEIVSAAQDSDVAIFAGGNIIMELSTLPTSIITLYRTIKALKKQNKKVCFCFCGVGPFASELSRKMAKKIILYADFISVRDQYSLSQVKQLVPSKAVEVWPDPVLSFSPELDAVEKNGIGVNVYFGNSKNSKDGMCDAYVTCIEELRKKHPQKPIYLFSSELTDVTDIKRVCEWFSCDPFVEYKGISSKEELFSFFSEIEFVLGARMHTLITATISDIPTVSIAWQGKVASMMELLGWAEYNLDMGDFVSEPWRVSELIQKRIDNKEKCSKEIRYKLSEIKDSLNKQIENFILMLEE